MSSTLQNLLIGSGSWAPSTLGSVFWWPEKENFCYFSDYLLEYWAYLKINERANIGLQVERLAVETANVLAVAAFIVAVQVTRCCRLRRWSGFYFGAGSWNSSSSNLTAYFICTLKDK